MNKCRPDKELEYPFERNFDAKELNYQDEICYGDCMNINFENGPFLRELGPIPEDSIPKKFIWGHAMPYHTGALKAKAGGDDDDEGGDDEDDDDE